MKRPTTKFASNQTTRNIELSYFLIDIMKYKCIGNKKRPVVKAIAMMIGGKLKIRVGLYTRMSICKISRRSQIYYLFYL